MVVDATRQPFTLTPLQIRALAQRHTGVGFDQLLVVELPTEADGAVDFRYRIFNADGGEVANCGNGARCFARFVREKGLFAGEVVRVATRSGILTLYHEAGEQVRVNMGVPNFNSHALPMQLPTAADYTLEIAGHPYRFGAVSMGNPHITLPVHSVATAPVESIGPQLESHPLFPERVNVGFMEIIHRTALRLRVFERGSGETLACGTGACAAVAIARSWGEVDSGVEVTLPGGRLTIQWEGADQPLWMSGPATTVFEGELMR